MSVKSPKYLKDLRVGDRFDVGDVVVEAEEMIGYAKAFDPQPIHLHDDAARAAGFSNVIASGWFTTSLAMRLFVARDPFNGTRILGFGADKIRWPTPTYVADRLDGTLSIMEILPKNVLDQRLEIALPEKFVSAEDDRELVVPAITLGFDRAMLELRSGLIIPDVVLELGDRRLLVEFESG